MGQWAMRPGAPERVHGGQLVQWVLLKKPRFMGQEHGLWSPLKLTYLACEMGCLTSLHKAAALRHREY